MGSIDRHKRMKMRSLKMRTIVDDPSKYMGIWVVRKLLTYEGFYLSSPDKCGLKGNNNGSTIWHAGGCGNSG